MSKKTPNNYVNNKNFYDALVKHFDNVKSAKEKHELERKNTEFVPPRIPEYIGECIYSISNGLSYKSNFINYPFVDEMIADGIENGIRYLDRFDPERGENPFAYFTQIIYFSFVRRIQKEKRNLYTKYKLTEQMNIMDEVSNNQAHDNTGYNNEITHSEGTQANIDNFIENYERTIEKGKEKNEKRKKSLGNNK